MSGYIYFFFLKKKNAILSFNKKKKKNISYMKTKNTTMQYTMRLGVFIRIRKGRVFLMRINA